MCSESIPLRNASRMRSLLRDAAEILAYQMRYWGMDARGGATSLLVRSGMRRIPRVHSHREGSSSYRGFWRGGQIELHSYCVGFYHPTRVGVLFSRGSERLSLAAPGEPPEPSHHREQILSAAPDAVLAGVEPLLQWLLVYENHVTRLCGADYRTLCWQRLGGQKFGPPPDACASWLNQFLHSRADTPRFADWPQDFQRQPKHLMDSN